MFRAWRKHIIGDMVKRQKIRVAEDETNFDCVLIGKAGKEDLEKDKKEKAKKTIYATFYVRQDGTKRFELKMRKAEQIEPLLFFLLMDDDQEEFKREAIKVLIKNFEIFTEKSRKTLKPELYVREPFWERFLDSAPRKEKPVRSSKAQKSRDELLASEKKAFSSVVGRLICHTNRYETVVSPEEIASKL